MEPKGPFSRIEYSPVNLNSSQQVKDYLLSQGWKPTEYNSKKNPDGSWTTTSPKLTEDSFGTIEGDTGQLVCRRNILRHRRNFLMNYGDPEGKGLLSFVKDGRVSASGIVCGTPTGRTRHLGAVCNVPGADAYLGPSVKSLYGVKDPYVMIGADLAAIEARIFGHYTFPYDGGEYARELLDGDIHSNNAKIFGCSRGGAKPIYYGILYGAGVGKVSSMLGVNTKKGKVLLDAFWQGNPGLNKLKQVIEAYYEEYGFIKGLDGRKLFIRQDYKLLNSLVQGAAAVVFKRWSNLASQKLRAAGNSAEGIMRVHDEVNYRVCPDDVPEAIRLITEACTEAGEYYNLRVPVAVDCKLGFNWFEVH